MELEIELLQSAVNNDVETIQNLPFSQITEASKRSEILLAAIESRSIDVVKFLIRHGFYTESMRNGHYDDRYQGGSRLAGGNEGYRVIHKAAQCNEVSVLKVLAEAGTDLNARNTREESALHIAVKLGKIEAVECLLAFNAHHSLQDAAGCTPLHYAITSQQSMIVQLLLKAKADISVKNNIGLNCLHRAALVGNADIVRALLSAIQQQQLVNQKSGDGLTALHLASREGHLEVATILIKDGNADIGIQNSNFQTALHFAVQGQHREMVHLLVKEGACVNVKDRDGDSPMHQAVLYLQPEQLQDLEDSHMHQVEDETFVFRMNKSVSIACFLAANGADLTTTNEKNEAPLDLFRGPNLVKRIIEGHVPHTLHIDNANQSLRNSNLPTNNMQQMQQELDTLNYKIVCPICRCHERDMVFMCGHFTCQECASRLEECPICREKIERRVRVFWA